MDVLYTHVAGLDVHKRTVVACTFIPGAKGTPQKAIRTFGTMTADLLALATWLTQQAITHVALESTGEYWKPVYNLLEASFTVIVANAQHIKTVPGRKTDVKDAEWIADLLRHGLLRASFIPPLPQRDLRDLTRQRTNLGQDRARVVNQLQKVLEWANLKLAAVVSDITGVSARAMLAAIVGGETDPAALAELADGRLRATPAELERALDGHVRAHHRFMVAQHLSHIAFLDEQVATFDAQIASVIAAQVPPAAPPTTDQAVAGAAPGHDAGAGTSSAENGTGSAAARTPAPIAWDEALALLDTAPGIGRRVAEMLLAEVGTDMGRFASAAHLASWAKLAPGNHQSAGKRRSGRTGHGSRWLRTALVQAANAAIKVADSHLQAVYRRLVGRRGHKKAIIAVAHRLLVAVYYMLRNREPYREVGNAPRSAAAQQQLVQRLQHRIEHLGYTVTLTPTTEPT